MVSLRNLFKYRISSLISSGSLALGILFAFVIFKFTAFERSYDQFVPGHEEKVRLNFAIDSDGSRTVNAATAPYPFTDLFVAQNPKIEDYTRIYDAGEGILSHTDRVSLKTKGITFSDQRLVGFMGMELLAGANIDDHDLKSVLISESLAQRLFGNAEAIDKTLTYLGVHEFVVKGVFRDLPKNSSVQLHFVGAMDFLNQLRPQYYQEGQNWGGYSFLTFYQLAQDTDLSQLAIKLNEQYQTRFEIDDTSSGEVFAFDFLPMAQMHLTTGAVRQQEEAVSEERVQMLEYLAYVILVIAWINFINLQSTKAQQRMKEIGLRRVFGAVSKNLYSLFVLEFGLLNIFSLSIAVLVLAVTGPYLEGFTGVDLDSAVFPLHAHPGLLAVLIIGVLLSSLYPAMLTVRNGASVKSTHAPGKDWFKKGLVTVQFAVSLFMIGYTMAVYLQVRHMSNQNPGFDTSQIMLVNGPMTRQASNLQQAEALKVQALGMPGVAIASWSGASPGVNQGWQGHLSEMMSPEGERLFQTTYLSNITDDYFEVFDIEVLAGRIPQRGTPHEEPRLVINQSALAGWGWQSPQEAVGKRVGYGSGSTIVAVVEDFKSLGFQQQVDPRIFIIDHLYQAHTATNYFVLKVNTQEATGLVDQVQTAFESAFPGNPFIHSFLDQEFAAQYARERAYNQVFSIFSGLAIALACVGMLGLVRYSAINRRREIGIRKVLGSGEFRIVHLFLREYLLLIVIAFLISGPVSFYLIDGWLSTFAYRIAVGPWLFVVPLSLLMGITLLTVGSISYRAAQTNPVSVLKEL